MAAMRPIDHSGFIFKQEDKQKMQVEIVVEGSALLYFKKGLWNVVFITDSCHNVKFSNPDGSGVYEPLARDKYPRLIDFTAAGTAPAVGPDPKVVDQFLNMSDKRLHGEQPSGKFSNLIVRPDANNGRQFVAMRVPYGSMDTMGVFSKPYYYAPYGEFIRRPLGKGVAKKFLIRFEVTDDKGLDMTIRDGVADITTNFPQRTDKLVLTFDNECLEWMPYNDFIHFYDWIYDERSTNPKYPIRFLAGEDTGPIRLEKDQENLNDNEITELDSKILGPEGDCDPVIIEPPPGD